MPEPEDEESEDLELRLGQDLLRLEEDERRLREDRAQLSRDPLRSIDEILQPDKTQPEVVRDKRKRARSPRPMHNK